MTSSSRCARRAVGSMTSYIRHFSSTTVYVPALALRPNVETARARRASASPATRWRCAVTGDRARRPGWRSTPSLDSDSADDRRHKCRAAPVTVGALGVRPRCTGSSPTSSRVFRLRRLLHRRPSRQQAGGRAAVTCRPPLTTQFARSQESRWQLRHLSTTT